MRLSIFCAFTYAAAIFMVSAIPGYRIHGLPAPDYVMHFIEYVGFGFVLLWSFLDSDLTANIYEAMCFSSVMGIVYGFYDELHQYFVPGRFASVHDLAADSAGSVAGVAAAMMFFAFRSLERQYAGQ